MRAINFTPETGCDAMFGWFSSQPTCPVEPSRRQWLETSWQWLEGQFGRDRVRNSPLVRPSAEYFPEEYAGTDDDARKMLDRVCEYMNVDPRRIALQIFSDQPIANFRPSALGTYRRRLQKFEIGIEYETLADPLTLVATMAHELGHVHLIGSGRISDEREDHEPLTDLLTVYFGMGLFSANAAVKEVNWRSGNFSGWSVGRQGYLDMRDYGYAFAMFARTRDEDGSEWARELRPDVRGAFKQTQQLFLNESGH